MATAVIMPRQGQSVESCLIGEWKKKVGDSVNVGDILFTYETDKAVFDEEAKVAGTLLAILCEDGDDVPCLNTVAVIGSEGEDISEFTAANEAKEESVSAKVEHAPNPTPAESVPAVASADIHGISPRARNTAIRVHADLSNIAPTGPNGRIIERDVINAPRTAVAVESQVSVSKPATAEVAVASKSGYHDEKLSHIRKVIAESMNKSLREAAQLTHHSSFDATDIIAYRKKLKASAEKLGLPNITYNDMLLFAVSRVLKKYPDLNAHYLGDKMRYFDHVHLGMAVDTPRGLLVPTIFNADQKSLSEIASESKSLAAAAQAGSISPDLLTGASFTVSNLGSLDVEVFTPIINPPQTGILGVDCMVDRVRIVDSQVTAYPAMGISLTYDHRALDGAPASRFLKELKTAMESFTSLLAQ